jgi:hypothetical protein
MGKPYFLILPAVLLIFLLTACQKNADPASYTPSYGDSILYLKASATDYIVYPTTTPAGGSFTGFPEGIEIDDRTGAINVTKSETGLRYRITYTAGNGDTSSTLVVLSGITFLDKFYHLSQHDSIAFPVYNASVGRSVPLNGSAFDDGNVANSGGCAMRTTNGQINLAESVRNGIFGNSPQNDVRKDFDILYKLNDGSHLSENKLKVRMYYYATMNDVAPDLLQTLTDRISQGVFLGLNPSFNLPGETARGTATSGIARPRPPCIIIVGQ